MNNTIRCIIITVWVAISALCFIGICYELSNPYHGNVVKYENWR
jgi:hypothetical protein